MSEVCTGTVRKFLPEKGYGFVRCSHHNDRDVFLHASELRAAGIHDWPEPGDHVSFAIREAPDGRLRATSVRMITGSET